MKTIDGQVYNPSIHAQLNDPKFVCQSPFGKIWEDAPNFEVERQTHIKAQTLLLPFLYKQAVETLSHFDSIPDYETFWSKAERLHTENPHVEKGWLCMNSFNTWEPVIDKVMMHLDIHPDDLAGFHLKGYDIFPRQNMDRIIRYCFGVPLPFSLS